MSLPHPSGSVLSGAPNLFGRGLKPALKTAGASLIFALSAGASAAGNNAVCAVDLDAVEAQITRLDRSYGEVAPSFDCAQTTEATQKAICADPELSRMMRLDDMAWVYAIENATGTEQDHAKPQADQSHLDRLATCGPEDTGCICGTFIERTNGSLGGESPYPQ